MVDRVGGMRRNTRYKMRKNVRSRGKLSIREYLKTFKEGDRVQLRAEPSVQKGMYFPRFYGKMGIVSRRVGSCYEIRIDDLGKKKTVVAHPVHLIASQ